VTPNIMDILEVKEFIRAQSAETEVFIGADSSKINVDGVWYADYCVAVVVHIDGKHGCKIFGKVERERVFDIKADKPSMRLMTEVYKVAELYLELADVLEDRLVEIHLDINPNKAHASSVVVQQAIGYIKGTCNITPAIKPNAFAASYAADRLKFILANR
jgi:predicted RNase H-related nuclease YkuK (DUF458 family)